MPDDAADAGPDGPLLGPEPPAKKPLRPPLTEEEKEAGFSSTHTGSFPELLRRLGMTLVVTTYQSGRLILLRADDGKLNTHFRIFESPMGLAVSGSRMVIGTRRAVHEYRDQPAVAGKVEPKGKHDACFLPRATHVTGDVRIHEVVFIDKRVHIVNTLFSCLATLDNDHSFVPTWRPPWVSALSPEDRCHLNGVAVREGAARYASCFGTTDKAGGWRDNKVSGGLLMEVPSGEILLEGLCMPHSPRWHDGALWFLESGKGTLSRLPVGGQPEVVATMPGFTRGLAFHGPYAFVGLSLVRDTLFEGIPIVDNPDRACGVWVIDTRNGSTVAFLRFGGIVQEVFDVQVLPRRFPELVEAGSDLVATSYTVPDAALADVPEQLRRPAPAG